MPKKNDTVRTNTNVFVNDVMRIIAAREIAASDRGHKDKLVGKFRAESSGNNITGFAALIRRSVWG